MKQLILTLLCLSGTAALWGQNGSGLTFHSPVIEQKVRSHVKVDNETPVTAALLDTVSVLDLSHSGLTDLRDLLYMPHLRRLYLGDNQLETISPLHKLLSLEYLDLQGNQYADVSLLSFSQASQMTVDVSLNYIESFEMFEGFLDCQFTLVGTGLQGDKSSPYLDVTRLYTNVDDDGLPLIHLSAETNAADQLSLTSGSETFSIDNDGEDRLVTLAQMPTTITPVYLTAGALADTTYVVPSTARLFTAGETRTLRLDLAPTFEISAIYAQQGEVDCDGLTITYTAPTDLTDEAISLSFSSNGMVKGYATLPVIEGLLGDVDVDGDVDDHDLTTLVGLLSGRAELSAPMTRSLDIAFLAADVNEDGVLSIADITTLISMLSNVAK